MSETVILLSVLAIPVLFAITVHEAAHGWVAWRLGDDTAYRLGRVTFNPFRHIDPFGTVLLPALLWLGSGGQMLFGYAKPVPVNFGRLHQPRRDMILVAAAGPSVNLAMAMTAALLMRLVVNVPGEFGEWLTANLQVAVWINVLLAVFNMLPIPPLDGGRVAVGLLPRELALMLAKTERYGLFIILGAAFVLPLIGREIGQDWNVLAWLVFTPAIWLRDVILLLAGVS